RRYNEVILAESQRVADDCCNSGQQLCCLLHSRRDYRQDRQTRHLKSFPRHQILRFQPNTGAAIVGQSWFRIVSAKQADEKQELSTYSIPNSLHSTFHLLSTRALVFASIRISSGQGRVKPSLDHLRVASMPILEPKLGRREAWSSESTGPSVNWISRS